MTMHCLPPAARRAGFLLSVLASSMAAGPAASADAQKPPTRVWVRYPAVPARLSPRAELGRQIFFDAALSASGRMSCASCHSPGHAYGPPNDLAVQPGGSDMRHPGVRAVPSLRYLTFTPLFDRHYYVPGSSESEDEGPTGGFMRDGSMQTLREQMAMPLLNPGEMANASREAVVDRLRRAPYAAAFRQVFGTDAFADPAEAFGHAGEAIEAFETEDPSFHPYTSKFDAVMSGNATFSKQELRGLLLFNRPDKGNCAKCHASSPGPGGRPAAFTDFGFAALGVPRNPEIPANRDPGYFDMGLCGPYRRDLAQETQYCGMFKTPTLRNVAARSVFFHNGRFHTLEDVVRFYVTRDIAPQKWYPKRPGGGIDLYDDLPIGYRMNVDRRTPPFDRGGRHAQPALSEAEIRDVIAFLKTLDDGWSVTSGGPRTAPK